MMENTGDVINLLSLDESGFNLYTMRTKVISLKGLTVKRSRNCDQSTRSRPYKDLIKTLYPLLDH